MIFVRKGERYLMFMPNMREEDINYLQNFFAAQGAIVQICGVPGLHSVEVATVEDSE